MTIEHVIIQTTAIYNILCANLFSVVNYEKIMKTFSSGPVYNYKENKFENYFLNTGNLK